MNPTSESLKFRKRCWTFLLLVFVGLPMGTIYGRRFVEQQLRHSVFMSDVSANEPEKTSDLQFRLDIPSLLDEDIDEVNRRVNVAFGSSPSWRGYSEDSSTTSSAVERTWKTSPIQLSVKYGRDSRKVIYFTLTKVDHIVGSREEFCRHGNLHTDSKLYRLNWANSIGHSDAYSGVVITPIP